MLRWSVVLVLLLGRLLTGDAAAAERVAVVTDEGFELRVPIDGRQLQLSEAAPDILEGARYLQDLEIMRILEMFLTREDIELAREGKDPRDLVFRISRHPISGASLIAKESWEDLRPRYRRELEATMKTENRSRLQEKTDEVFNEKLEDDDKIRLNRLGQVVAYHEDETSLRFSTMIEVEQGAGDEVRSGVVRGFTATVFIGNRLFMMHGVRNLDTTDQGTGFEQDQAEFDRFVDRMIELNP